MNSSKFNLIEFNDNCTRDTSSTSSLRFLVIVMNSESFYALILTFLMYVRLVACLPHFLIAVFFCPFLPALSRDPQPGCFLIKLRFSSRRLLQQMLTFQIKVIFSRQIRMFPKNIKTKNSLTATCSFSLKCSLANLPSLILPAVSSSRKTKSGLNTYHSSERTHILVSSFSQES